MKSRQGPEPADETATDTETASDTDSDTGTDTETTETGTGTEVVDPVLSVDGLSLAGGRTQFQSRDVIVISVDYDVVSGADAFSLTNVTDPEGPIELIDRQPVPEAGEFDPGLSLALVDKSGQRLLVPFYPGPNRGNLFHYGLNRIRVESFDEVEPRYAEVELTVRDFEVFGVAATVFEGGEAVAEDDGGAHFEGWLNTVAPAAVTMAAGTNAKTAPERRLVHGFHGIVNGH